MYKHKNISDGIAVIFDSKQKRYELKPGETVTIDRAASPGFGTIIIDEKEETEEKTKKKKDKEVEK